MVLAAGVPVVPISVSGTDDIMPKGARFRRLTKVTVIVGEPLDFSRFHGLDNDRFILRAITDEVMLNILALGTQGYVDVYASTIKKNSEFDPQREEVTAASS